MGLETKANGLKDNPSTNENIDDAHGVQQNSQQSDFDERIEAQKLLRAIAQKIDCLPKLSLEKVIALLNEVQSLLPKS